MLAIEVTIGIIVTLPFMIPWYIWAAIMWIYLKHRHTAEGAKLLVMAYVDTINGPVWKELLRFIVWPYGIASRTYEILNFIKSE